MLKRTPPAVESKKTDDFTHNLEQTQESVETPRRLKPADLSRVRQAAQRLAAELGDVPDGDLVGEIVDNAIKILHDHANRGDVKLMNKSMKEIRYALKVFAPYRETRKVSIFGSARTPETDPDYQQALQFAKRMAELGWMVITGAGPGIMAAGHGGAGADPSFGLAIRLPLEQAANRFIINDSKLINFKYFFTRKLMFVRSASAVAMFPGGFGTMDESFEVLTLVQTGKSVPMPIVFVDHPGGTFWIKWMEYVHKCLLGRGLISPSDLHLFKITNSSDEAIREITHFYSNYHSIRTVKNELVIRLHRAPTPEQLQQVNRKFADLTQEGGDFRVSPPLPLESNEPKLSRLARLVFPFNNKDHGRLRMLIDYLNNLQ